MKDMLAKGRKVAGGLAAPADGLQTVAAARSGTPQFVYGDKGSQALEPEVLVFRQTRI